MRSGRFALVVGVVSVGVALCMCAAGCPGSGGKHNAGDAPSAENDAAIPEGAHGVFDAGKDPDRNHVKAGHICKRFAEIQCAGEAFCCDDPGRDRDTCEAEQADLCTTRIYLDAMSLSKVSGFDATRAATELNRFEKLASQCDPSISAFALEAEGLLSMMKGTVAAGGDCAPAAADAESVAAALSSCEDVGTTACLPQNTLTWTCTARGGVGESCFTDVNCEPGLYCPNPSQQIGSKTCSERKALGKSCATPNECESLYCQGGACVPATSQAAYCLTVL